LPARQQYCKGFMDFCRQRRYRDGMKDAQTDPAVRQYIATQVRMELARNRMSMREAARRLGWEPTVLYRRAIGERGFEAAELAQVARLLGVPIEQFFPDDLASTTITVL
jgi:hypothetical protein